MRKHSTASSPGLVQQAAEIVERARMPRHARQDLAIACFRIRRAPLLAKQDAQIVAGIEVARIEGDGTLIGGHRLVRAPEGIQRLTQIVVEQRDVFALPDRRADQPDGFLMPTRLMLDDTEQVQGIRL